MQNPEAGSFLATLRILFQKGIRYSTVIDAGCADGHFFLLLWEMGIVPGAVPFNIDANRIFEDSLQAIKSVAGGDFAISALTDHDGEIEFTMATHPYWSSLRPEGDAYWVMLNNLSATKSVVPATTLDTLCKQSALKPPYLLKLDVQGAERETLQGGAGMLKDTHVVVCEALADDFREINDVLVQHDFVLYDVTEIYRLTDGALGWFYPVYVKGALEDVRAKSFWDAKHNEAIVKSQGQRRESILKFNMAMLARMRRERAATQQMPQRSPALVSRNDPCPCGSGKRYKHCCGAHR